MTNITSIHMEFLKRKKEEKKASLPFSPFGGGVGFVQYLEISTLIT